MRRSWVRRQSVRQQHVANFGLDPNGEILQINLSTGVVTPFITNTQLAAVAGRPSVGLRPGGPGVGPDGDLYIAQSIQLGTTSGDVVSAEDRQVGGVLSYDPSTPAVVVASTGLAYPHGLTFGVNAGDTDDAVRQQHRQRPGLQGRRNDGRGTPRAAVRRQGSGELDFPTTDIPCVGCERIDTPSMRATM